MKPKNALEKKLKVSKQDSNLFVIVAVATVITIFCLVSSKTLFSQVTYHRRVLNARRVAIKQLNDNITAANTLEQQYQVFQTGSPTNIIGGKNSTDQNLQPPDGDNARLVLDALPSTYDFPALISSVAKILDNNGVKNPSIDASDDSSTTDSKPQARPQATNMTLTVNGTANYKAVRGLISDFERSTRPFDITSVDFKGSEGNMTFSLIMNTYFQPALSLELTTKDVK